MTSTISQAHAEPAPFYYRTRASMTFCAPMITNALLMPYFPVWLKSLNLVDWQIGLITGIPLIVRVIVAPIVSALSDHIGERAVVLFWSGLTSLIACAAMFYTVAFWPVLLVYGLLGAFFSPYSPISESLMMTGARRWNYSYGHMRMWGSMLFIVSTLVGGWLVGSSGATMILPAITFGFFLTVLGGLIAPHTGQSRLKPIPAPTAVPKSERIFRKPDFLLIMVGVTLSGSSHAMLYTFSSLYWEQIGFSGSQIGILWAAGVAAEVCIFLASGWLLKRFSIWQLIFTGTLMSIVRWSTFPLITSFYLFIPLQCLHAFTFATAHLGLQATIVKRVSEKQEATAQGLYFFYSNIFLAAATFFSGFVFNRFGGTSFLFMCILAVAGTLSVLAAWLIQPQSAASGGNTSESS
jgi:MFS transporter, PPP family, 3-phenylpropionic acid transporter